MMALTQHNGLVARLGAVRQRLPPLPMVVHNRHHRHRGRRMHLPHRAVVATLLVAGTVLTAAPGVQGQRAEPSRAQSLQPAQLQPHRAVYEFSLGKSRSDKGVAALSGRMVYEFTGSPCEGYTQTMRFVIRTSAASGAVSVSDQRSTSWEDDSGMRYRFQSSQYRDQKLVDQTAGTATRGEGTEDTRIEITHPDRRRSAIGGSALFPVQHSLRLLDAARRGRTMFVSDFFDGAEGGEKTYLVSAQIAKPVAAGFNRTLPRVGQADKLDGVQAWPVLLSYYEQGGESKDALPIYEMAFVYYANGISRRLVIDNGEYTMNGELSQLEMLEPLPCRRP